MLIYYRNWFMWLQRSRSLMTCHLQVREPGKLVVCHSFWVWRPKKQECQCLRAGGGGHPSSSLEQICPPIIFSLKQNYRGFLKIIYFWLHWVFILARIFFRCDKQGLPSSCGAGLLIAWLLLLCSPGSRCMGFSSCGSWALECRLGSCGTQA